MNNKYINLSYKELHKLAKKYFNQFIRLRDTDDYGHGNCIVEGYPVKYGTENCHAGHFFSGSKYRLLEFDEDNVHVQSRENNFYGESESKLFKARLINKIGIKRFIIIEKIAILSKQKNYEQDKFKLIEIIDTYKEKCSNLAKEKMFEVKL